MAFIISKPGFDVYDPDPRNLIFHSDRNHLKTAASGSFQKVFGSSGVQSQIISHSLGYRPLVLSYFKNVADGRYLICYADAPSSYYRLSGNVNVSFRVSTTQVIFSLESSSALTVEVEYEIFYEGL